jgi:uncharacterized protein (DUF433 family)
MHERIEINAQVQHGKPVIRGTRVPVARVLGSLAGGMTYDEICAEYRVEPDDIRAALNFAEELVEAESHYALPVP